MVKVDGLSKIDACHWRDAILEELLLSTPPGQIFVWYEPKAYDTYAVLHTNVHRVHRT